ncbi:MAG: hypothetical protein ABW352_01920 [Polyangiales bacterium]
MSVPSERRDASLALVGGALEHFDACIQAVAVMFVFPPLFEPPGARQALPGAVLTWYLARPLGAMLFGALGDSAGGRRALAGATMLAAGSSVAIGVLPGFATLGTASTVALSCLLFLHAAGLGGTWAGAAVWAFDGAGDARDPRRAKLVQLAAPLGIVVAQGLLALHTGPWDLRLFFLASTPLLVIGLRAWRAPDEVARRASSAPLRELARRHLGALLAGVCAVACSAALRSFAMSFGLGSGQSAFGSARGVLLGVLSALVLMVPGILLALRLSRSWGTRPTMGLGFALTVVAGLLLIPLMRGGLGGGHSGGLMIFFAATPAVVFLLGFTYGPLALFLPALFPAGVRFTGAALSLVLGNLLGATLLPRLATLLLPDRELGQCAWLGLAAALGMLALRRRDASM